MDYEVVLKKNALIPTWAEIRQTRSAVYGPRSKLAPTRTEADGQDRVLVLDARQDSARVHVRQTRRAVTGPRPRRKLAPIETETCGADALVLDGRQMQTMP